MNDPLLNLIIDIGKQANEALDNAEALLNTIQTQGDNKS